MIRIKKLLREKGLKQADLAEMLNISPSALAQSISGNPTLDRLEAIAKALDVTVPELFEDENEVNLLVEYKGDVRKIEKKDLIKLFGDDKQ